MLIDVGQHIPYAKKEVLKYVRNSSSLAQVAQINESYVDLKTLWPEPNWIEMHLDGIQVDVLASIYSIYHSLAKKPHAIEQYKIGGIRVTLKMWASAYEEAILFIRKACENATSIEFIDQLETTFNEEFNIDSKPSYKTYAAGTKTPRTFFHPLGRNDFANVYKKLLPFLNWPLGVKANKIPFFPIELKHSATQDVTYSLGRINKKSVSWKHSINGSENEFKTYEEAVHALITIHGKEFIIPEDQRQAPPIYVPKKNLHLMAGVDESYPNLSAEALMSQYGFRGVQFGNYLPHKERQAYVNNAFHSFGLLSHILGIPYHWIGGGKLGLAFGARGNGYASAHYELELHVINLTRFNGPGSIAHEVFHSFDARMAEKWFNRIGLLSNLLAKLSTNDPCVNPKYRNRVEAFSKLVANCTAKSDYLQNAINLESQKGGSKYWGQPAELCARAFEAYIQDKLEGLGVYNQWLALGCKQNDYVDNSMHPYPVGSDRKRINTVFEQSIPAIFGPE